MDKGAGSKSEREEETRAAHVQGETAREDPVGLEGDRGVPVYRLRCRRCGSCEFDLGVRLRCQVCGLSMPLRLT